MTVDEPETIGFLLLPQFSMVAFSAAIEPLRLANRSASGELYRWTLVSPRGGLERASNGVAVMTDASLDPNGRLPTVIVCSGIDGHWYDDPVVLAWLRHQAARGARVGSVCTGSHILARAGLLNGYRCTIHWENLPGFIENFPDLAVTGDLYTIDRDRFTCAGGTAATDMMLALIAARHGDELARRVSQAMIHEEIRAGNRPQPGPMREHEAVFAAVEHMKANLEEPVTLEQAAARTGQSRRTLERAFQKYLGTSPARYYLSLRLEHGHQLLSQTAMSVTEVALACGFVSPAHFSRRYHERFGVPPRADRARRESIGSLLGSKPGAGNPSAQPA